MDPQTRNKLKEKILLEIKNTERGIENLIELTKPITPDCSIGRITRMDAINNKSLAELNLRMSQQKLTKLKLAITKIANPKFGACAICQKNIHEKRLMFMPESQYCVHCAQ